MNIKYGNREGQYFTEWRFDILRELLELFHLGPVPGSSQVMEVVDPEIWYDEHDDFHRLKFSSGGKLFEVRLYKVFSCDIDGEKAWSGCPQRLIYEFASSLRKRAGLVCP